ncbi:MAG: alpha/beta hydrolase [Pseudomonadota bacterium]
MTLHYRPQTESNSPVVALHSSASNSRQWTQLSHDLEHRFSLHAFDLPGYGKNSLVSDHSVQGAAVSATPVIQKVEKLEAPVHLVGHSNGAGIALKVAMMRPDLVKSLTLYEPATFHILRTGDEHSKTLLGQIEFVSGIVTASAAMGDAHGGMRHFLDYWNGEGFWDQLPGPARQKFASMINSIMSDFANGFNEPWKLSDIRDLEIPTLIMMGLESPAVTQRVSTLIAQALPDARLALLPELGHMAPISQPEWVNARILEHITSVERSIVHCSWPSRKAA